MKRLAVLASAVLVLGLSTGSASATLLFSDLFAWYDNGSVTMTDFLGGGTGVVRGPGGIPVRGGGVGNLLLKIEEDVLRYDPIVHPFVTPGMDRYVYTISNVGFDSGNVPYNYVPQFGAPGPLTGTGYNGVSGFNIQNLSNTPVFNMGAPTDPVTGTMWSTNCCQPAPANIEWDIPVGYGVGAPVAGSPLTQNSFFYEVKSGATHGVRPVWVHSWDTNGSQVNVMTGFVTAPVPEPASLLLLGAGLLGATAARRRKKL